MTLPEAPSPDGLRAHYTRFLSRDRALLTGHSHQAWPDAARDGLVASFDDAALHIDDKWGRAFEAAAAVRDAVARRVGGSARDVALAGNTHELVARFLSALPLAAKRHVVTTAGEFHSIHRQLRRLAEEGVAVTFVDPHPATTLAARLADAIRSDTAAVLTSTVLFETSERVHGTRGLIDAAHAKGAAVLLDAYHAFNVVPIDPAETAGAFVTGGGYKYAQWGEGVCFLRVPTGCALRPVYTGWFADFAHLSDRRTDAPVSYGSDGADRFAGSTYDPASHYRARAVVHFFDAQGLTVPALRDVSLRQTERIFEGLARAGWSAATPRDPSLRGGFVSVRVDNVSELVEAMRGDAVYVDARGALVRLGPAPYVTDDEIDRAVASFVRHARRP